MEQSSLALSDREASSEEAFTPITSNGVCNKLGDKWTVSLLWRLSLAPGRRLRFSALQDQLAGITQRMLTLTLRNLERDGFVSRHFHPEVPPRVEYELTNLGAGIIPALEPLNGWLRENLAAIEVNRDGYDRAKS